MSRQIYLDHNATTPMLPEVVQCVSDCLNEQYANPASQHAEGRRARMRLNEAKEVIGKAVGARMSGPQRDRIVITSGGTESNNSALRGLAGSLPCEILISAIEHPSVIGAAEWLGQNGCQVRTIPVDSDGIVNASVLESMITDQTRLVSVMLGNNETGALQRIPELADVCHRHDVLIHTDAVQAVGKIEVDFSTLGVDAMSLTAHKFHGPRGVGALILQESTPFQPLLVGGAQQLGLRPGTENVALVCGMARALEIFAEEENSSDPRAKRLAILRDRFESLLLDSVVGLEIHCFNALRLPHTSSVSFPNWDRQALLIALDRSGIACSTGSACASGSSEPSHVLQAMGCDTSSVEGALRFSFGCTSEVGMVEDAARRILNVVLPQKTA